VVCLFFNTTFNMKINTFKSLTSIQSSLLVKMYYCSFRVRTAAILVAVILLLSNPVRVQI